MIVLHRHGFGRVVDVDHIGQHRSVWEEPPLVEVNKRFQQGLPPEPECIRDDPIVDIADTERPSILGPMQKMAILRAGIDGFGKAAK
jgi:hypothetical protein